MDTVTVMACSDCAAILANDDDSGIESAARVSEIREAIGARDITLGTDDCENPECRDSLHNGFGLPDAHYDENHDDESFSWSPCEICGTSLGGYRYGMTEWFTD